MILERSNLYGAPGDAFNYACQLLLAENDYIADLKGTIGVQGNSGEEVAQRILQRKTNDHAEDRRGGEERAEINFVVELLEKMTKNKIAKATSVKILRTRVGAS